MTSGACSPSRAGISFALCRFLMLGRQKFPLQCAGYGVHVCLCVCLCVCVCLWVHVCLCVSMCVCVYGCVCLWVYVSMGVCLWGRGCGCVPPCVCVSVCMRLCVCVCLWVYMGTSAWGVSVSVSVCVSGVGNRCIRVWVQLAEWCSQSLGWYVKCVDTPHGLLISPLARLFMRVLDLIFMSVLGGGFPTLGILRHQPGVLNSVLTLSATEHHIPQAQSYMTTFCFRCQ